MRLLVALVVVLVLALAIVTVTLTVPGEVFNVVLRFLQKVAPIVAATIAALGLALTGFSTYSGVRQRKRQVTLEAFSEWSDATSAARSLFTRAFGEGPISQQQAQALMDGSEFKMADGSIMKPADVVELRRLVVTALNGLERLAAGVFEDVYDLNVIVRLGGTIIIRNWERFESYVDVRRQAPSLKLRQKRAYVEYERLVGEVRERQIDEDRIRYLEGR